MELIAILQDQGTISPTLPERVSAFNELRVRIYLDNENLKHRRWACRCLGSCV
jgi:hypothetical protein